MSAKSDELRSLEECISSLVDFLCGGVVELHWFAGKLVESNLITRQASDAALKRQGASERDIAERLLRAVVTQVEADEDQFLEFIKLLKSEDALKAVHKKLTKSYGESAATVLGFGGVAFEPYHLPDARSLVCALHDCNTVSL